MRARFSNQTIAGVISALTLFLLYFGLRLGALSIALAILVFFGVLLALAPSPPKRAVEEREYTLRDLERALERIAEEDIASPSGREVVRQGEKIALYLNKNPMEAPSCLFQTTSVLNGVQLAAERRRVLMERAGGSDKHADDLLENYLQAAANSLAKIHDGLLHKDRQELKRLVEALAQEQAAMEEAAQALNQE